MLFEFLWERIYIWKWFSVISYQGGVVWKFRVPVEKHWFEKFIGGGSIYESGSNCL